MISSNADTLRILANRTAETSDELREIFGNEELLAAVEKGKQ